LKGFNIRIYVKEYFSWPRINKDSMLCIKNKINIQESYINPDSLRILILFASSISDDDIDRSIVLCEETV